MMKNNSREQTGRMMGALMRMSKLDVGAPEAAYPARVWSDEIRVSIGALSMAAGAYR